MAHGVSAGGERRAGRRRLVPGLVGLAVLVTLAATGVVAARLAAVNPVVATVTVGSIPVSLAVDEQTGRAFVLNNGDDTVSVLDTRTGAFLRAVPVGSGPTGLLVDGRGGRVVVIDSATTVSPQTGQFVLLRPLWSGNPGLSILDGASGRPLGSIHAQASLAGGAVDARHGRIFVATGDGLLLDDGSVGVLQRTGVRPLASVPGGVLALAVDGRANRIVVASDAQGGTVSVLDAASGRLVRQSVVGSMLPGESLAVDEQTGRAFAVTADLDGNKGTVCVFDTRTGRLLRTTALDSAAAAVAVDAGSGHAFISTLGPATPIDVAPGYRPYYRPLSVPISTGAGSLTVVDARSGAIVRSTRIGIAPGPLAVDARRHRVLVASVGAMDSLGAPMGGGTLSVVDARTGAVLQTVPVGVAPGDIAVDERAGRALVLALGGAVHASDAWGWLPPWLRQRVPFLPQQAPGAGSEPGTVTVLDTARL